MKRGHFPPSRDLIGRSHENFPTHFSLSASQNWPILVLYRVGQGLLERFRLQCALLLSIGMCEVSICFHRDFRLSHFCLQIMCRGDIFQKIIGTSQIPMLIIQYTHTSTLGEGSWRRGQKDKYKIFHSNSYFPLCEQQIMLLGAVTWAIILPSFSDAASLM